MKSSNYKKFEKLMKEIGKLESIENKVFWDQRTHMPEAGASVAGSQISLLNRITHKKTVSKKMERLLKKLDKEKNDLDEYQRANLREMKRIYERSANVPDSLVEKISKAQSKSYQAWAKAKEKSDFSIFQPHLEKMVGLKKEYAGYVNSDENPYKVLMEGFEPFVDLGVVRKNFKKIKNGLLLIIEKINKSNIEFKKDFLEKSYSPKKQMKFCRHLSKEIGFDYNKGRIDKTVHPFTTDITPTDIRLTTRFDKNDPRKSIFSTLHEAGHGLYCQGLPEERTFTAVSSHRSLGVHESQSRLYENNIGRSYEFWEKYFPELKKTFKSQLKGYDTKDFYKVINEVKPSFIRVYADEVTYNTHILLRFEIEENLINGNLEVKDIPEVWNNKMEKYLGVRPKKDSRGCLQDVHWSEGYFGYFPTYTIGNLLAAQIYEKMDKSLPNVKKKVRNGKLQKVKNWLNNKIHEKGCLYKTDELIKRVTGEKLNADYFIKYIENKYGDLYNL